MTNLMQRVISAYHKYCKDPYLRDGQRWFLALHDANPSLAKNITGHEKYDPFYKDDNISDFMSWLTRTSELSNN